MFFFTLFWQTAKLCKTNWFDLKIVVCVLLKKQSVMNLVATHYNCTSPMDYISHHALHTHIPVHHYTNHTAVTIHSLVLIVSPHLHLIHSHTFKQHSHMHSLRSLVFPWLTFWAFPGVYLDCPSLLWPFAACPLTCLPVDIFSVCCLPRPCIVLVADSV